MGLQVRKQRMSTDRPKLNHTYVLTKPYYYLFPDKELLFIKLYIIEVKKRDKELCYGTQNICLKVPFLTPKSYFYPN